MNHALFEYPKQAAFYRILPKSKIYDNAKPSSTLRQKFITQIDKIVWQYKLAPETINLAPRANVPEIQVFAVFLRTLDFDEGILRCIDQVITFPIFYQLMFKDRIKVAAAYKRPSDVDSNKWVVGDDYFETSWQLTSTERRALPVALDLSSLYDQMLRQLMPLPPRPGESLKVHVERLAEIRSKQNEYHKIETLLHREKQFNRKVELNAQLRILKNELDILSGQLL